jgi:probable rRNA maturation factor
MSTVSPTGISDNLFSIAAKLCCAELNLLRLLEMLDKDSMVKIGFHFRHKGTLRNRVPLKIFLIYLFKNEKTALSSLQYIFCSDEELRIINRDFLQHDYLTDIITFPLSEKNSAIEGEIHISLERIKENARDYGETYNKELHRVIFHGALHLCGYKDKSRKDSVLMRKKEDFYLKRYLG